MIDLITSINSISDVCIIGNVSIIISIVIVSTVISEEKTAIK